jgi:Fic family protein
MSNSRLTNRLNFDFKTSQRILKLISKIDSQNARWQAQVNLSPQMVDRLIQSVLITSTGSSTRIEGSRMDDKQVKDLYKNLRIKKFKTRDEQEVAGYLEALKIVFENWAELKFGESLIKQLHSLLLKYSDKDERHKGSYKFQPNRVEARDQDGNLVQVIFNPTEPYLVPKEMQELADCIYPKKQLAVRQALQGSDLLSRSQMQRIAQIPPPTVRQDLLKSIEINRVEAVEEGKATKYRVKSK